MTDAPQPKQLNTEAIHALHLCMWAHTVAVEAKLGAILAQLEQINARQEAGLTVSVTGLGI